MKIEIAPHAIKDMQEIFDYIKENDSIESAAYVDSNLKERIKTLSNMPERGSFVKELLRLGRKTHREIYFKPYRIIYRIKGNKVIVVLVADGRRDFKSLLQKRLPSHIPS
jgi:toxin ParE1/3/4